MKLYMTSLLAAVALGVTAVELGAMPSPTQLAVLQNRRPDCVQNSCQSAIQATDFCTCIRQGAQDCSSYFVTTVVAATETVYSTTYASYTSYTTESDTVTTTVDITATSTKDITVKTSTTTTMTNALPSPQQKRDTASKKNRVKRGAKRMPYYAMAACQDERAYESACACAGVYRSTVYSGTVTSTQVVVEPTYSPTLTETTVASTESSSRTVTTETVTRTASTRIAVSTAIFRGPFWIQIMSQSSQSVGNNVIGKFLSTGSFNPNSDFNTITFFAASDSPFGDRALFTIDPQGYLRPIGISRGDGVDLYLAAQAVTSDVNWNYGTTAESAAESGQTLFQVWLSSGNQLVLLKPSSYNFRWCNGYAAIGPYGEGDNQACFAVTLLAIPVVVD